MQHLNSAVLFSPTFCHKRIRSGWKGDKIGCDPSPTVAVQDRTKAANRAFFFSNLTLHNSSASGTPHSRIRTIASKTLSIHAYRHCHGDLHIVWSDLTKRYVLSGARRFASCGCDGQPRQCSRLHNIADALPGGTTRANLLRANSKYNQNFSTACQIYKKLRTLDEYFLATQALPHAAQLGDQEPARSPFPPNQRISEPALAVFFRLSGD